MERFTETVKQMMEWGDYPEYVAVVHSVVTGRDGFTVTDLWQLLELVLDGETVIVEPQPDGGFTVKRANGQDPTINYNLLAAGLGLSVEAAGRFMNEGFIRAFYVSKTTRSGPRFRPDSH